MYYTDYHTHSTISPDSQNTLYTLCKSTRRAGVRELCVTDHWNLVDQLGREQPRFDWTASRKQYKALKERFLGKVELRLGLEVGNGVLDEAAVAAVLDQPELDFVIGSLHNLSPKYQNKGAFTVARQVSNAEEGKAMLDDYMEVLWQLANSDGYDVLGHVIYPLRYLPREYGLTLEPRWEKLAETLKVIIAKGKGMEINTSGGTTVADWVPYLKLYKDLGGEILTFGSDAHRPQQVGAGIAEAYDLARDAGFRFVTTYKSRVPFFTTL